MFDVGFSEMMLIGLIALLVLGPERLPPLIRGLGRWVGRAQRTVRELKTQLENDTSLRELNQVKQSLKSELNAPIEPTAPAKSLSDSGPDAR